MKTTNTDALLPCPFCQAIPDLQHKEIWPFPDAGHAYLEVFVECPKCHCTKGTWTVAKLCSREIAERDRAAIATWNIRDTRTPKPSVTSEDIERRIIDIIDQNYEYGGVDSKGAAQAILTAFHVSKKE